MTAHRPPGSEKHQNQSAFAELRRDKPNTNKPSTAEEVLTADDVCGWPFAGHKPALPWPRWGRVTSRWGLVRFLFTHTFAPGATFLPVLRTLGIAEVANREHDLAHGGSWRGNQNDCADLPKARTDLRSHWTGTLTPVGRPRAGNRYSSVSGRVRRVRACALSTVGNNQGKNAVFLRFFTSPPCEKRPEQRLSNFLAKTSCPHNP
jgi:hypothetical protein